MRPARSCRACSSNGSAKAPISSLLGLPDTTVRAARTLRRRLLSIPGRLTRHARGWTLHLPDRWPWHGDYISAAIRALAAA